LIPINKNHNFYQTILASFDEDSVQRQAIESLIFCSAIGEHHALTKVFDVDSESIEKVIQKFKRSLSMNLDTWSLANQDLVQDA